MQDRLAELGIHLFIVRVAAGASIYTTVFQDAMAKCVGFVAMGSATDGVNVVVLVVITAANILWLYFRLTQL